MGITSYTRTFLPSDRKRFYLKTARGRVIEFVVQYETLADDEWLPVVRWDTAHGYAHKDVLNWRGRVVEKTALRNIDHRQALKIADDDIDSNWKEYKKRFFKGR